MRYKKALLTATCLLGLAGTAMAAPVGMVCKIDGTPSLKSGGKTQALRKLQRVEPGDTIACGGGESAVVVLFASGERFAIGANRNGTVQRTAVSGAKSLGKLGGASASVARELGNSRTGAVMGRAPLSRQHLSGQSQGWLPAGERKFSWKPIKDATAYTFALFDRYGNVLWSTRVQADASTTTPSAEYPADLPAPALNRPYIWRLTGFRDSGKPLTESRWGLITWLAPEDGEAMTAATRELQDQAAANPENAAALQLQRAQIFSDYGVYSKTLDVLEDSKEPNRDETIRLIYEDISPYVAYLGAASRAEGAGLLE